jgi:hypothetical protein
MREHLYTHDIHTWARHHLDAIEDKAVPAESGVFDAVG